MNLFFKGYGKMIKILRLANKLNTITLAFLMASFLLSFTVSAMEEDSDEATPFPQIKRLHWQTEENVALRRIYTPEKRNDLICAEMSKKFDDTYRIYTPESIEVQKKRLGLARKNSNRNQAPKSWEEEEEIFLKKLVGEGKSEAQIIDKLTKEFGNKYRQKYTPGGIQGQKKKFGLAKKRKTQGKSIKEVPLRWQEDETKLLEGCVASEMKATESSKVLEEQFGEEYRKYTSKSVDKQMRKIKENINKNKSSGKIKSSNTFLHFKPKEIIQKKNILPKKKLNSQDDAIFITREEKSPLKKRKLKHFNKNNEILEVNSDDDVINDEEASNSQDGDTHFAKEPYLKKIKTDKKKYINNSNVLEVNSDEEIDNDDDYQYVGIYKK